MRKEMGKREQEREQDNIQGEEYKSKRHRGEKGKEKEKKAKDG